jgi:peptidoglycan/xylan/chitin deacetylase (PgdA/CDA1 family)
MSSEELARLAAGGGVELGAHTVHHQSLLTMAGEEQRSEVARSRAFLTERTGRAPASFAFPFGDNSARSRRIVRSCGFDHAVGIREALPLTAASRRFELPRLMPIEEPAAALGARLEALLGRDRRSAAAG